MEQIPFGPKPKIVDLTSDRKLADKVLSHLCLSPVPVYCWPPAVLVAIAFQCGDTSTHHAKHTSLQASMTCIRQSLTLQYCLFSARHCNNAR